jgi:hypothetical protein
MKNDECNQIKFHKLTTSKSALNYAVDSRFNHFQDELVTVCTSNTPQCARGGNSSLITP